MLTAHHISKTYDFKPVLKNVSFSLNRGDRAGLIGPNGSGKTTLIRILAGMDQPDDGYVSLSPKELRTGYLGQSFASAPGLTLGDCLESALGNPAQVEDELAYLSSKLANDPGDGELQSAYDAALRRIEQLDPTQPARQAEILASLGLDGLPRDMLVSTLSGGQKTRLGLALVLLEDPQLLLLDEPTNHLDISRLEWLESWLVGYTTRRDSAALIITHDRAFLDRTATRILELDPESQVVRDYPGNYSSYLELVTAEYDHKLAAYRDQVVEIRRMKQDIARTKQQSLRVELTTTSRQPGVRRIAKKVAKKAKSREKKLDRYLDSDDRVEKPKQGWQMKLEFAEHTHIGQEVLIMEDLAIGYPGHPPLLEGFTRSIRLGERIVLTGPNGAGKTTLLRTIAGQLEPLGGKLRLGSSVRLGYMAQEQELINPEWSALETIQNHANLTETEARSFLHFYLFSGDDALRPARELSFGERARLSLATLVVQGSNFLLLDEPINHLDIPSRERFEKALQAFDGTILAVVHDRYFMDRFASDLWEL